MSAGSRLPGAVMIGAIEGRIRWNDGVRGVTGQGRVRQIRATSRLGPGGIGLHDVQGCALTSTAASPSRQAS